MTRTFINMAATKRSLDVGTIELDVTRPDDAALAWWYSDAASSGVPADRLRAELRTRMVVGHAVLKHADSRLESDARAQAEATDAAWMARLEQQREALEKEHAEERQRLRARVEALDRELAGYADRLRAVVEEMSRKQADDWSARQSRIDDELNRVRERTTIAFEEERARLHAAYAELCARAGEAGDTRTALTVLASRLDARDAEIRAQVSRIADAAHSAEVARMRDALSQLQSENERLRGSNHVKGARGEAAAMASLRRAFPDRVFLDTSARGAESDFHMVDAEGGVLAVEVKNKAVVTAGDVDKSMRDVRELLERLGGRLVGYLFVSLRTRNIPRKGALALEAVHGVPVMWYGLDGGVLLEDDAGICRDAEDLARCARVLLDVGRCMGRGGAESDSGGADGSSGSSSDAAVVSAMLGAVANHLHRMDGVRRAVSAVGDSISSARRHLASLSALVDTGFRELEACLRASGLPLPREPAEVPTRDDRTDDTVACPKCMRVFGSRQALGGHSRACRGRMPPGP